MREPPLASASIKSEARTTATEETTVSIDASIRDDLQLARELIDEAIQILDSSENPRAVRRRAGDHVEGVTEAASTALMSARQKIRVQHELVRLGLRSDASAAQTVDQEWEERVNNLLRITTDAATSELLRAMLLSDPERSRARFQGRRFHIPEAADLLK